MQAIEICKHFGFQEDEIDATKDIVKGLINNTILVKTKKGKYILQEINARVFKEPDKLMSNIARVTTHIRQKLIAEHGDADNGTLNLLQTTDGKNYVHIVDEDNIDHYYRMYKYIEHASSYDEASPELLYNAGKGFGKFQRQLSDFPAEELFESIPDFHNTIARYLQFSEAFTQCISEGKSKEIITAKKAINYAHDNKPYAGLIMNALNAHEIPLRVVHNDTKLNNVMLDDLTHEPVCVIDLDTIMPGSLLFDYGDAIRYACNTGLEDEQVLSSVTIDLKKFKAFTDGFLKETARTLTAKELELLPQSPIVLAYELGLRFLTDYLNGNKYFKCDSRRPNHNLERANAQFKLAEEMKKHLPEMQTIVYSLYRKNLSHDDIPLS